ncbi:unnamed protein product [Lepidochelys kempii]
MRLFSSRSLIKILNSFGPRPLKDLPGTLLLSGDSHSVTFESCQAEAGRDGGGLWDGPCSPACLVRCPQQGERCSWRPALTCPGDPFSQLQGRIWGKFQLKLTQKGFQ